MKKSLSFVGLLTLMMVLGGCLTAPSGQMTNTEAAAISKYMARQESNRGK